MGRGDLLTKKRQNIDNRAAGSGKEKDGNIRRKIDVEKGIDRTYFSIVVRMMLRQRDNAGITMESRFRRVGVKREGKLKEEKG